MEHMVVENNHLKGIINDLQGKVKEKNKEITKLKIAMVDLDQKIVDKNNEITKKDKEML